MALNDTQLAQLKVELDADPKTLGYAGTSAPECADLLNEVGLLGDTIGNTSVPVYKVRDEILANEFTNVSAGKRDLILMLLGDGDLELDITNSKLVAQFMDTFTVATAPNTRAALIALATRDCSRAEFLFGADVVVNMFDVAEARQL